MNIGFDIDGVLSAFEFGFAPLLTQVSGVKFPKVGHPDWPDTWDWDLAAGVTKDQSKQAWGLVKASNDFWLSLPPNRFCASSLAELDRLRKQGHKVYFITTRFGETALQQSAAWLVKQGFAEPQVYIAVTPEEKARLAALLMLDFFIDDRPSNCETVVGAGRVAVFILDQPWNRWWDNDKELVLRVGDPLDALKWLEEKHELSTVRV